MTLRLLTHVVIASVLAAACASVAQEQPPAKEPPEAELPSLDELLGLEEAGEADRDEGALPPDTTRRELERKLSGEEAAEAFQEAARLMGEAADRLEDAGDVGIDTQRLQEEIIRRLEMIIDSAEQQRSQSSSSSGTPQSRPEGGEVPQQQPREGAQAGAGDNRQRATPPGLREGDLGPAPALGSAAWGALPQRVREAISQGTSDEFSALYQGLTEAYYRRLAEEANR